MAIGDIEKMAGVGLVWGATNALIRRGALLYDQAQPRSPKAQQAHKNLSKRILFSLINCLSFLFFWQYSFPFLLNLSASAAFFALLKDSPISLAVPFTNATTFAATAFFGILLGEQTRVGFALVGTGFIVVGAWLCIY